MVSRGEAVLDLCDFGAELKEAQLRARHPEWSDAQVRQAMWEFWSNRPSAPFGDVTGGRLRA